MFNLKINVIVAGAAFILSFLLGLISRSHLPMLVIRPVIFAVVFFIIFACIQILINRFLPELQEGGKAAESPDFLPGTRINITEDDPMTSPMDYTADGGQDLTQGTSQESVPDTGPQIQNRPSTGARPNELDKEIGDISQLTSVIRTASKAEETGIDQNQESGYNEQGEEDVPEFEQVETLDSSEAHEAKGPSSEKTEAAPSTEMPEFFFASSARSSSDEVLPDLDSMAGAFSSASSDEESEGSEYPVSMSIAKTNTGRHDIGWSEDFPPKDIASGVRTVLNKDKEA